MSFLHKGDELSEYEPYVHQTNVGSGRKLSHHTVKTTFDMNIRKLEFCSVPHLTKSVVVTSITVRFTVTAASK